MENIYCSITGGRPDSMKVKLFLRFSFLFILGAVKIVFGMDWAFIVGLVILAADLDEIASLLDKKFKNKC